MAVTLRGESSVKTVAVAKIRPLQPVQIPIFLPATRTHRGSFMLDWPFQVRKGMSLHGVLIPRRFALRSPCGGYSQVAVGFLFLAFNRVLPGIGQGLYFFVRGRSKMAQGTIKKLIADKGFGFIEGEKGDLFFHHSAVEGATIETLQIGQEVFVRRGTGSKGAAG